jgi:hypothetical protein
MTQIEKLETELAQIKSALGSKLAECRIMAGYGKSAQHFGLKSPNVIFNIEDGRNFPNKSTLQYFIDLYEINSRDLVILQGLHDRGREAKKQIIRFKRGWNK